MILPDLVTVSPGGVGFSYPRDHGFLEGFIILSYALLRLPYVVLR